MIHKIKALYDEGRGSSLHAIAQALGISRNTVRKYLAMSAEAIAADQGQRGPRPSNQAWGEPSIWISSPQRPRRSRS